MKGKRGKEPCGEYDSGKVCRDVITTRSNIPSPGARKEAKNTHRRKSRKRSRTWSKTGLQILFRGNVEISGGKRSNFRRKKEEIYVPKRRQERLSPDRTRIVEPENKAENRKDSVQRGNKFNREKDGTIAV